uniref:Reverse transcriptase N-terminal domain-containing protein n=1 Tax=Lophocladia kuetzingii TaxID=675577 RepID=A0A1Z1MPD2_9FLOR|nr:hypothetical protein [Lophocladia kuetzingii]ARW67621.1 hypothetical protein [Lophocladia kuetzingii]
MIQKQIYLNYKKYNFSYVKKLQTYLIHANESKIFSIQKIIEKIYIKHHDFKYFDQYIFQDNYKIYLLKNLFNTKFLELDNQTNKIIKKINQYLIYLSIQPVVQTKFSEIISNYFFVYEKIVNFFLKNQQNNLKNYKLKVYYYNKKFFSKFKFLNYISKLNQKCLYIDYYISLDNLTINNILQVKLVDYCINNNLYNILNRIILLDFYWYLLNNIKSRIINQYLEKKLLKVLIHIFNKSSKIKNNNINLYKYLIYNFIKLLLYEKKIKRYIKINLNLNNKYILKQLNKIYNLFNESYMYFVFIKLTRELNKLTNIFLYHWMKKKRYCRYNQISKNNYYINNSIYFHNLYKCYKKINT